MKGEGFVRRKERYKEKGGNLKSCVHLCDGTTWKISPAVMYSLASQRPLDNWILKN